MKIIKIKYSKGSLGKNNGTESAPNEILKELKNIWLNESFKELKFTSEDSDIKNIKEGDIYLGGDHSITEPIIKKISKNSKNFGLIVFDAHPDVYKEFEFPTHGDWLYHLIEEGIVKKENIILIGIRNPDIKEIDYLEKNNIKFYTAKELYLDRENICNLIMEKARNFDHIHISVDIDSLDPSIAPGTGYLEPAGLSARELLYYIQRLSFVKNKKTFDLVEVNPLKDTNNITVKTAAKIVGEFL
ncbi:MAG: arginase family protein [Nanoarchaeota archaeon]|nr:arginase family protein [Nanoarchaeota archaeon]MBU0962972.1 arginase family protein [Nanoarchaeota archaeon]